MAETDDNKPKRIVIKPKSAAAEPATTPEARPAETPPAAKPAEAKAAAEDKPASGLVSMSTLLTAVGGLIAALATLLTALNAAGIIGRPTATPVPPTATHTVVAIAATATPMPTATAVPTEIAVVLPSPTPLPSRTPVPWLTLSPAATPVSATPSAAGGLMVDSFSDPDSGWDVVSKPDYALAYVDGAYRMTVIKANNEVWSTHSGTAAMSDYVIEVDARRVAGPEDNDFGVVFRVQPGNEDFYQFRISSDGLYTLRRFQDDVWTDLQPWTESPVIAGGDATNHIRIEAIGPFLRCFVNGQMLAAAQDEAFAAGRVGLSAGTYAEGGVSIDFDNLRVVSLAPAPAGPAQAVGYRLYDDFADPGTGWETASSTDYATGYVDGAYRMVVYRPNYEIWSTDPRTEALTDHVIEVDVRRIAGPEDNDFGVVFRVQPGNDEFYMFALSSNGFYTVQVREAGEWTDLQPWTKNAAIMGGEATNRVRVEAIGPHMRFMINGQVLTIIEDETFAGGRVGFSAGTFAEEGAQLEFDNLQIVSLYPF